MSIRNIMEQRLSPSDRTLLKAVYSPQITAVPPADAHRDLCLLPSGEIRHYGRKEVDGIVRRVYLCSSDCGLSWKTVLVEQDNQLGAMVKSPWSDQFITLLRSQNYNLLSDPVLAGKEYDGVYCITSFQGPGGTDARRIKLEVPELLDIRQPVPLRTRKRWLCTAQTWKDGALTPVVLRSDDDAETWDFTILASVPPFTIRYPHQGMRWQQYSCEPTLEELSDGRILMISRTSQDYHYQYLSEDGGETWSKPVPSVFHATTTMPTLLRLSDGRLLHFWCNTQPLPELDHSLQPELSEDERNGVWEDVFTNRDACHAAVSTDDGKTWRGFRELHLNEVRNAADFRSGGHCISDKSVHQFQALELPFGKVLLSFGQNKACRKIILFDPDWLLETSRGEDFRGGLEHLSTQVFVKSLSGGCRGFAGHCAWNRTNGALLVPTPDPEHREVLQLARIHDERLFREEQGAVWNFPAADRGEVEVVLQIPGVGIELSLCDHWFHPVDTTTREFAQYTVSLPSLPQTGWHTLILRWDTAEKSAKVLLNGHLLDTIPLQQPAPVGISYLHLQTLAREPDFRGTLIKSLRMNAR